MTKAELQTAKERLELENKVLKCRLELIDKLLHSPDKYKSSSNVIGVCMFLAGDNDRIKHYLEDPNRIDYMYSVVTEDPEFADIFYPEVEK